MIINWGKTHCCQAKLDPCVSLGAGPERRSQVAKSNCKSLTVHIYTNTPTVTIPTDVLHRCYLPYGTLYDLCSVGTQKSTETKQTNKCLLQKTNIWRYLCINYTKIIRCENNKTCKKLVMNSCKDPICTHLSTQVAGETKCPCTFPWNCGVKCDWVSSHFFSWTSCFPYPKF